MGRPKITEEQRVVAVALLANAIRQEAYLRERADDSEQRLGLVLGSGTRRSHEAARQYLHGMRDLLAVLFEGGRAAADECYEAAKVQALGEPSSAP